MAEQPTEHRLKPVVQRVQELETFMREKLADAFDDDAAEWRERMKQIDEEQAI